jgi:protein disulfide-isomerase A6
VIQSKGLWLVEFFAPWCGHCKNLAPEWEKAAKALEGIINIGAVDMTTDQEAGAAYGIQGFPTIKFFGENKQSPQDYNEGRTASDIIAFALNQAKTVANARIGAKSSSSSSGSGSSSGHGSGSGDSADDKDVIVLEESTFDEKVLGSNDSWFIEFYAPWCGHCKNLAPHWARLATELKGEIKVAKVDATQNSGLAGRFDVKGYPSIKFFPAGPKSDSSAIDYSGQRETSSMASWAREQHENLKPLLFGQLTNQEQFNEYCTDYRGVLVLAFLPHIYDTTASERNDYIKLVEDTASANKGKPFSYLWSEGGAQLALEEQVQVGGAGYPAVVAISCKKKLYSVMRGAFNDKNLGTFVKQLILGKGSFLSYK